MFFCYKKADMKISITFYIAAMRQNNIQITEDHNCNWLLLAYTFQMIELFVQINGIKLLIYAD